MNLKAPAACWNAPRVWQRYNTVLLAAAGVSCVQSQSSSTRQILICRFAHMSYLTSFLFITPPPPPLFTSPHHRNDSYLLFSLKHTWLLVTIYSPLFRHNPTQQHAPQQSPAVLQYLTSCLRTRLVAAESFIRASAAMSHTGLHTSRSHVMNY